ncbi:MAG: phosphate signaling complex protein PhoU [Oligoflexales bacterium]
MTKSMEKDLESLKQQLLSLGSLVEEAVSKAVLALDKRDEKLGREVINHDVQVDLMEVSVEENCLGILALHQPVASDLRFIIAALKINNDLERIGDIAVNIAERTLFLCNQPQVKAPFDYKTMAAKARAMLRASIDAFVKSSPQLAHDVRKMDDEVDAINREMYSVVFEKMKQDPLMVEAYCQYISISRHLERIGDYATNIAEDVIYMIDGTIVRHRPEFA